MLLQHRHTSDLPLLRLTPQHRKLKPNEEKQKVITYFCVSPCLQQNKHIKNTQAHSMVLNLHDHTVKLFFLTK
jgi:hypothetical protein